MEKKVLKPSFRRTACFLALLISLTLLFPCGIHKARAESDIAVVCLNIGKADSILIKGEGWAYLVDTGYEQSFPAIQAMLSQYGVKRLDGVFLTHCHKDHSGSLMRLAQSGIEVAAWLGAEIFYDIKPQKHPLLLAANEAGASVTWLKAGDVVQAGPDASFTVLGPLAVDTDNENNNSLVLRFSSPYGSVLLCGDMKEAEERSLLSSGMITPCDILKCGHHGDGGATSGALLSAVRPKYAVISTATGEEEDTPSPGTLKRLYAAGASVYVTQDFRDAVEFLLGSGGITARDVAWDGIPERVRGLSMRISLDDDTVAVFNATSSDIIVEEAVLYSSKGTQLFDLGSLYIPASGSVVIGSAISPSSCSLYVQSKKRVWHTEELDTAVLYDKWGRPLAWTNNGMPE